MRSGDDIVGDELPLNGGVCNDAGKYDDNECGGGCDVRDPR